MSSLDKKIFHIRVQGRNSFHQNYWKAFHVFVRHGAVRKPLHMSYGGPFVLQQIDKFHEIDVREKLTAISIYRFKPIFLEHDDSTQHDHSYTI